MRILAILLIATAAWGKCGIERAGIKNLADAEAGNIGSTVYVTTIHDLRLLKAPADLHKIPDHRHDPVELTRYHLRAFLMAYKLETDEDYHLVLADPSNTALTMIGEIPGVYCMDASEAAVVAAEQGWVDKTFGKPRGVGRLKKLAKPVLVEVEGIGFFDFLHGQTGVAPNGVEIHPILSIKIASGS